MSTMVAGRVLVFSLDMKKGLLHVPSLIVERKKGGFGKLT